MPIRLFHHCPVGKGGRLAPPAAPKGVAVHPPHRRGFYHFAACPPEDVVHHLEYQDQEGPGGGALQSSAAGVGLCGPVHPVLLLPQARQGHLPGGGRPPPEPRRPAGDGPPGVLGADVPPVPFGGRGVPAPVRPHSCRWTAPWPSSLPWCWWPMGPSFSSSPGSISGCAGRFSPACLPRPTAGGGLAQKTGVLYHIALPRATARGRVFPWRPGPSCIAVSKTLHFSRFSCSFSINFASPTVRLL